MSRYKTFIWSIICDHILETTCGRERDISHFELSAASHVGKLPGLQYLSAKQYGILNITHVTGMNGSMTMLRMFSKRPVRSNQGFTLVATMLAIAALGVLTMAVMTLLKSMNSSAQHVNSEAGARALISTLQGTIGYTALCFNSLDATTRVFNPTAAASLDGLPLSFNLGAGQQVGANQTLLPYDVRVRSLTYHTDSPPIGADPLIAGNRLFTGQLFLSLTKLGGSSAAGGSEMKKRAVGTLVLSVNSTTNAISRCYALVDAEQACKELNGIFDSAATPKCKLPFPCAGIPNSIFLGYNSSNVPQCKTVAQIVGSTCPSGQYLTADGSGGASCQAPP